MAQLEINFGGNKDQLPINFDTRFGKPKHVSEIANNLLSLVSCKCGQCDNRCGRFIPKDDQRLSDEQK